MQGFTYYFLQTERNEVGRALKGVNTRKKGGKGGENMGN